MLITIRHYRKKLKTQINGKALGQALLSDSGNLDILIIRETTTACAHKEQGGVDGDEIKTEEI